MLHYITHVSVLTAHQLETLRPQPLPHAHQVALVGELPQDLPSLCLVGTAALTWESEMAHGVKVYRTTLTAYLSQEHNIPTGGALLLTDHEGRKMLFGLPWDTLVQTTTTHESPASPSDPVRHQLRATWSALYPALIIV